MSSGKKVKAIEVPGGALVRLETDLEFGEVAKIADKHGLNWLYLLSSPELGTGTALVDLYALACRTAGAEVPAKVTARMLMDAVRDVDDDLPEYYQDSYPKEDAPTTG